MSDINARFMIADITEVTAQEDRDFYSAVFGSALVMLNVGNKMAATYSGNSVTISDGVAMQEGGRLHINKGLTDVFTIPTGTEGTTTTYYIGYKVHSDNTPIEQIVSTSRRTNTSLRSGDSEMDIYLYSVRQTGTNITAVTPLFNTVDDVYTMYANLKKSREWASNECTSTGYVSFRGTPRYIHNDKFAIVTLNGVVITAVPAAGGLAWIANDRTINTNYAAEVIDAAGNISYTNIYLQNGQIRSGSALAVGTRINCCFPFLL